jgi:hypothetical protein
MNRQRIKLSDNFHLDEFVPREFYVNLERQVNITQFIRTRTGLPVTVNNWWGGGRLQERGLRMPNSTVGGALSQHRLMNAGDISIGNWTGKQMYDFVVENARALFNLGVRRIETHTLTPTWLHLDCKPHNERAILVLDLTRVIDRIPV